MVNHTLSELLNDQRVKTEVERHKWLESEKVGYDIGYEKAAQDWLNRYGRNWQEKNRSGGVGANRVGKAAESKVSAKDRKKGRI